MFDNKNILITGGTGSFGNYFTDKLLKNYNPNKVIIFCICVAMNMLDVGTPF